ncbi:hypothetical protein AWC06_15700 [Mycobacterium fragae]|uniref:Uncharacterized protein n=2 Tax=Mycobacterium fragae TaxID=1260918 RepID=A0A1X1USC8_9MYCO|nr:hypothetical protein AWC06_15700 [Mycobacterium fragae]
MFRNQVNLSPTAFLAREAVQNSSDAFWRFQRDHPADKLKLRVVFRFVELTGTAKASMIESLGLGALNQRRGSAAFRKPPVGPGTALDHLEDSDVPLTLLYVEDYSTHGLYGHPSHTRDSIMFRAMLEVGGSEKDSGVGGSYGFGKAALVGVSKAKVIVAHTTFEPSEQDPARTRLLGVTWWRSHEADDEHYGGRAIFAGEGTEDKRINPFEDDEAEEVAERLGFRPRNPDNLNELGTSFLIVDPLVDPSELIDQLAIWWWPALEDHMFDVEVVTPDSRVTTPRPAMLPVVAQFLTPYRIAKKEQEPQDPNREQYASGIWRNTNRAGGSDLGGLGLVVADDPIGMDGEPAEGTAVVALMRNPRMIIRYQEYKQRIPLRGVFVASDKSNELLQETEPSSHDAWSTDPSTDVSEMATLTAQAVLDKIRRSVSKMAKEVAPPPPRTPRALSHFAKLMSGFVGKKRGPKPKPGPGGEPIELQFPKGTSLSVVGDDQVKVTSDFTVRVADDAPKSTCDVTVSCQLHVSEDENPNGATLPVLIAPEGKDHGFTKDGDGAWSGPITKTKKTTFSVTSEPYSNLWTTTVQPVVTVDSWSEQ